MVIYSGLFICWLLFSVSLLRFAFIRSKDGPLYHNRFLRIMMKAIALSHIATPTITGASGFSFILPASLAIYGLVIGYITNFMNIRVYPVKANIIIALCALLTTFIIFMIAGLLYSFVKEWINSNKR